MTKTIRDDNVNIIPCKPKLKLIKDKLVVGIITETDQLIPTEPIQNFTDELDTLDDHNYILFDTTTINNNEIDKERIEVLNNISLENFSYRVKMRNIISLLLCKYMYTTIVATLRPP